jgi:hypothetical protein
MEISRNVLKISYNTPNNVRKPEVGTGRLKSKSGEEYDFN